MSQRKYLLIAGVLLLFFTQGWGQTDPGTPDTVRVGTVTATAFGQKIMLNVFGYNDENLAGIGVPIDYDGISLIPDSVSFVGGRLAGASVLPVTIDTTGQKIFFGAVFFGAPVPPGTGLFAKVFFTVKDSIPPDTVEVDTFNLPPSILSFVEPNGNEFEPKFVPGRVFVNVPGPPTPHDPVVTVPGPQQVFAGFTISFGVTATDVDTGDVLTITKSGPGSFSHIPKKSPASGSFSWTTTTADTIGNPHVVTFNVNDGTGRADTGTVDITVLPFTTPPSGQDGDLNGDGSITLQDVVYLINFIFHDGPPPNPMASGDINGDCFITIADIVYLSNYVLKGGPAPVPFCLPGDVNHDGYVNLPDIVYFINYILKSGAVPVSLKSSDVNADCLVNLADIVFLVNFIFKGGPIPQPGCVALSGGLAAGIQLPTAELGLSGNRRGDVLEVELNLNMAQVAAGLMFKVDYDPAKLKGLEPRLTTRTGNMTLHYNDKGYQQTIGLLDLMGINTVAPGQGTVLVLRFQVLDRTDLESAFRLAFSEVVAQNAQPFDTRLVKSFLTIPGSEK